jgi:hypothetical protein
VGDLLFCPLGLLHLMVRKTPADGSAAAVPALVVSWFLLLGATGFCYRQTRWSRFALFLLGLCLLMLLNIIGWDVLGKDIPLMPKM